MRLQRPSFWIIAAFALPAAFILCLYLFKILPDYLFGEAFYIFHLADTRNHLDAVNTFFTQNGRFFEGVYWTYLYKIVGYAPSTLFLLSLILHFLGSILGALAITRAWKSQMFASSFVFFILTQLFFFNLYSLELSLRLSIDNGRIAIIFFWFCTLAVQQWVVSSQRKWLMLGILLFVFATNTYENIVLFFPAAMLLAWPLQSEKARADQRSLFKYLGLTALASTSILIPFFIYRNLASTNNGAATHPIVSYSVSLLSFPSRFINAVLLLVKNVRFFGQGNFEGISLFENLLFLLLIGLLLVSGYLFWRNYLAKNVFRQQVRIVLENHHISIYIAGLWMLVIGLVTYGLVGFNEATRVYSSAVLGIPIIFLFVLENTKKDKLLALYGVCSFVFLSYSTYYYLDVSKRFRSLEPTYNNFYYELKTLVPDVKDNTNFVFINFRINGFHCGPSMNMLYGKQNLGCATIGRSNDEWQAERYEGILNTYFGGWLRYGNEIYLGYNEAGNLEIVPEITAEDDLLIKWIVEDPLQTDYKRILNQTDSSSGFYEHLLLRHEMLNSND